MCSPPFALAIAWWSFADTFGLTQARAMRKMDDRRAERRTRAMEALGIDARRERKVRQARDLARRTAGRRAEGPARHEHEPGHRGARAGARRAPALTPFQSPPQSPSSTAPLLALDAFLANLASTPRV